MVGFKKFFHNSRRQWKRFKRAFQYANPNKAHLLLIFFTTLLIAGVNVAEPLIMKFIFDKLGKPGTLEPIAGGIVLFLILAIIREVSYIISNWLSWKTRLTVHSGLLNKLVSRLHHLPFDYHRKEGVGATMTKLERGVQGFVNALGEISFNVLPAIIYLIMAIFIMFKLDWRMSVLVLFFSPMPAIIAKFAAPKQVRREKFLLSQWGKIYSRFNEVLSGLTLVRSFAMEDYEKKRFMNGVNKANNVVKKGVLFDSSIGASQNIVVAIARIAAISLGVFLVFKDQLTLGTLIAFLGYVGGLFGPVQGLTTIYKTTQTASVSLDHIFSIIDNEDYLGDAPGAIQLKDVKGSVQFDQLYFSFKDNTELLKNIDFTVKPGENIALVGPSGSGKSTLMSLLQRFYDPTGGRILIDGIDVKKIKQDSLRKHIGVVLQDPLLFNESVRNNIAYGRPSASLEEITEAAKVANIHERILEMNQGYNTVVGERGGNLSVGERQRIAIARALLKDPEIFILDEATSALDVELEALVQEALEKLVNNRTSFFIAHRLSTIVNADKILVLKNGHIIEQGSHKELLEKNGYYKFLVEKQTKGLIYPNLLFNDKNYNVA